MDPYLRLFIYESWVKDQEEEAETVKNNAYLLGSFINPEMVNRILDAEKNSHTMSDEAFDELSEKIRNFNSVKISKRKRKHKLTK